MVKDNHWRALAGAGGTLAAAPERAQARGISALYVEVESLEQLEQACAAGATRLLVDNQTPDTVRAWGGRARDCATGIEIEATGGITLENVRAYAEAGADFVSIGALTHWSRRRTSHRGAGLGPGVLAALGGETRRDLTPVAAGGFDGWRSRRELEGRLTLTQ